MANVVALIVVHSDTCHLRAVIRALLPKPGEPGVPILLVVNKQPFKGKVSGDWQAGVRIGEEEGAEVAIIDAKGEKNHRKEALRLAREHANYTHAIVADADEILQRKLVVNLLKLAEADVVDVAQAAMETFFWSCSHLVRPRETIRPVIMVNLATAECLRCREWRGERDITLSEAHCLILHASWIRSPADARFKIDSWAHAGEVHKGWLMNGFLASHQNPLLRHVHPTHPPAYDHLERIPKPSELSLCWDGNPIHPEPALVGEPVRCSVVIPLHGGEDVIELLHSLHPLVRKTKRKAGKASKRRPEAPPNFDPGGRRQPRRYGRPGWRDVSLGSPYQAVAAGRLCRRL